MFALHLRIFLFNFMIFLMLMLHWLSMSVLYQWLFATLGGDGTGMVGSVSNIFHFFGDFLLDIFLASDQEMLEK